MGKSRTPGRRRAGAAVVVSRSTRFDHAATRAARRAEARAQAAVGGVERVGWWPRLRDRPAPESVSDTGAGTGGPAAPVSDTGRAGTAAVGAGETAAGGDERRRENARRVLVAVRNRRRRWPWAAAGVAGAAGVGGHYASAVLTVLGGAAPGVLAAPAAAVPVVAAGVVATRYRSVLSGSVLSRWWPELTAGAAASSVLAYGLAASGPSPALGAAALVSTSVLGARWWRSHPVGPGVPSLTAPALPPVSRPDPEHDPYCLAWAANNASKQGKVPGSRLTGRVDDAHTTRFEVVLRPGVHSVADLQAQRDKLAGGLGEATERVLFAPMGRGVSSSRARLTIIRNDPVAKPRLFRAPQVERGVIRGVARRVDGSGETDVTMWKRRGTVPLMIVGTTGGGKSGAANIITAAAMSTGVFNLLYVDPKLNSSTALAERARVAIVDEPNVLRAPVLVEALVAARRRIAAERRSDLILPSRVPGWMFLHDEYSISAASPPAAGVWTKTVNTARSLGIWVVACNQSQGQPQWGGDHARSAFASQVIAFRTESNSSSDLVPGLLFNPKDLPIDDAGDPVPGMAVHKNVSAPVRWDWLPTADDAAELVADGHPAPEVTAEAVFDEFFAQPELHPLDDAAITSILGPAVNGRWQVGGTGATHELPDADGAGGGVLVPAAPWGHRGPANAVATDAETAVAETGVGADTLVSVIAAETGLSPVAVEVLALIRAGTDTPKTLVTASAGSRAAVHTALDALIGAGLIVRAGRGRYQAVKTVG